MTPLHAACLSGNKQIVKLLLDSGAIHDVSDNNGYMPLHYAVVKDHDNVVEFLNDYRDGTQNIYVLDEKKYSCNGFKIMSLAILNGSYRCIKKFVYLGASCNEKDLYDYTCLHTAAISGHVNIFLYFLSK